MQIHIYNFFFFFFFFFFLVYSFFFLIVIKDPLLQILSSNIAKAVYNCFNISNVFGVEVNNKKRDEERKNDVKTCFPSFSTNLQFITEVFIFIFIFIHSIIHCIHICSHFCSFFVFHCFIHRFFRTFLNLVGFLSIIKCIFNRVCH